MSDNTLLDKIKTLPKWLVISVASVLVIVIGCVGVYFGFGFNKITRDEVVDPNSLLPDMPNASVSEDTRSQLQAYRDGDAISSSRRSVEDYWDNLGSDLVSSPGSEKSSTSVDGMDELRATGNYSDLELRQIRDGIRSKLEIDTEHAREKEMLARRSGKSVGSASGGMVRPMTQAQKDSAYFERMERALELASRYTSSGGGTADDEQEQSSPVPVEEPERTLPLEKEASVLPSDSFDGNGIISSLDSPSENEVVHYSGKRSSKPVKACFLKNEKLQSGQRVIIRLMQDLLLSDGTLIPANSHITGTCSFEKRIKINVKSLHYGGRMFSVDISVYDNDGTEGLYCPVVEKDNQKKKAIKDVAQGVVNAAGSVAGTLLTGNPLVGAAASRSLSSVSSSINSDGTVSVSVVSGYVFYVFENVKDEKNS